MPVAAVVQINQGLRRGAERQFPRAEPLGYSGWSIAKLVQLQELNHAFRSDLTEIADLLGETRHHCNLALDAMLGRTPAQAYVWLEARARPLVAA